MENTVEAGSILQRPIVCNDPAVHALVLDRHKKTLTEYTQMIAAFFGANPPAPKTFQAAQIQTILGNYDCNQYKLMVTADETQMATNNEITLNVEIIEQLDVSYSITLFRALLSVHAPEQIHFSKAKSVDVNGEDKIDIVFKATKAGMTVYCGDLSDVLP